MYVRERERIMSASAYGHARVRLHVKANTDSRKSSVYNHLPHIGGVIRIGPGPIRQ